MQTFVNQQNEDITDEEDLSADEDSAELEMLDSGSTNIHECLAIVLQNGRRALGITLFRKDRCIEYFDEIFPQCCVRGDMMGFTNYLFGKNIQNHKLVTIFLTLTLIEHRTALNCYELDRSNFQLTQTQVHPPKPNFETF